MAVTAVRKFSIEHNGEVCRVLCIQEDSKGAISYLIANPSGEINWLSDASVRKVYFELDD